MFVLRSQVSWGVCPEYYKGKTYQYNYEIYPETSKYIKEAKIYKNLNNAKKSCKSLNNKISSEHYFKVIEIGLKNKLQKEKIDKINILLANIIQSKENICEIVQRKCEICPLNIDDKCNELNLSEFDFTNYKWLDNLEDDY